MSSITLMLPLLAGLALFGVLLLLATDRLIRDTLLAARLILFLGVISTMLDSVTPTPVVAGFTVLPADVLFGVIALAAVGRVLRARRLRGAPLALVIVAAMVVLALVRGVVAYGLQPAINESRAFLYFVFGALYFSLTPPTPELRHRIGRALIQAAWLLVGTVVVRWVALATPLPAVGPLARVEEGGVRVIDNPAALLLLLACFAALGAWQNDDASLHLRRLGWASLVVVLFLQHRTVWVALIVGVMVLAVQRPELGRRVVTAVLVGGALAAAGIGVLQNLEDSPLPQSPVSAQTVLWRYEGWRALLADGSGTLESILIGQPLGAGYSREIFGYEVDVTPHNYFLQVYLRTGVIGVTALVAALGLTIHGLRRRVGTRHDRLLDPDVLLLMVIIEAVFMLTWAPELTHGLLVGLAAANATAASGHGEVAGPAVPARPAHRALRRLGTGAGAPR